MASIADDRIDTEINGQKVTLRKDKEAVAGFVDRGSNFREEEGGFLVADRWVAYLNERRNPDHSGSDTQAGQDAEQASDKD